eukprot:1895322-Pyramimonas_sp.AAC.1
MLGGSFSQGILLPGLRKDNSSPVLGGGSKDVIGYLLVRVAWVFPSGRPVAVGKVAPLLRSVWNSNSRVLRVVGDRACS